MRQRVYFIGVNKNSGLDINKFKWPEHKPVPALSDFLTDRRPISEWMEDYLPGYLNNEANGGKYTMPDLLKMDGKVLDTRMSDLRIYDGKVPTLRSQRDGILYVQNGKIYSLTGHEALLLQGFPREYADKVYNVVSDRHLLMQAGNAMTVSVIQALGEQLIALFKSIKKPNKNNNKTMPLQDWEIFERECADYLHRQYSINTGCQFIPSGGHNSHESDIHVKKGAMNLFSIEAKMGKAQCGQFVLFANDSTRKFTYSPRNEFPLNEFSQRIMDAMAADYDRYCAPSNDAMDIDKNLFYDWIKNHYSEGRNTRFVITKGREYILLPINKFDQYFDVEARYRPKGSGSGDPPKKRINEVADALHAASISFSNLAFDGDYLNVVISNPISDKFVLRGGEYRYQFKKEGENVFNVRKLSNTRNANVIFSISLKKEQDTDDLRTFESSLL